MAGQSIADIQNGLVRAQRAMELFQLGLTIFQANCQRGEFEAAELERTPMIAALESYLDEFAAAQRIAEALNRQT